MTIRQSGMYLEMQILDTGAVRLCMCSMLQWHPKSVSVNWSILSTANETAGRKARDNLPCLGGQGISYHPIRTHEIKSSSGNACWVWHRGGTEA